MLGEEHLEVLDLLLRLLALEVLHGAARVQNYASYLTTGAAASDSQQSSLLAVWRGWPCAVCSPRGKRFRYFPVIK